ncbi:MAG: nucleotidyltransferase family protein [Actinomyces urogenitalis]|uniref:nucleotidyltransferase family protein n=1 Tax=Actinomyces urogenitalis TaxID=103621 RepID=UPI002A807E59|nr:nucleotidyltransferase family protein [Actinomyces urogenitalis]MDY3679417.1 nucleotidyltransferase family protein [Actinomyces urogenitalis]
MDATTLASRARHADELIARGRRELESTVREAYAAGLTQRQIAQCVGRSQSEVNRLVRFHGTGPRARVLRRSRSRVREILAEAGLLRPRVFGSTARGEDREDSDIDLLVTSPRAVSLLEQARIERRLSECVGLPVDLVLEESLRPDLRDRVLREAVPL